MSAVAGGAVNPASILAPATAATIFSVLSVMALALAVALLIGSIPRLGWPVAIAGGLAAGLFPPVIGSLYFGQANLFVLLLLAFAYRGVGPGPMLGVASAIKLYPASGFLALLAVRPRRWRQIALGLVVLGALLLVDGPIPQMRVQLWAALAVAIPMGAITVFLMSIAMKARRNKVVTGEQGMIGEVAIVCASLNPAGKVFVQGELWDAVAPVSVEAGRKVVVRKVENLVLQVEPVRELVPQTSVAG